MVGAVLCSADLVLVLVVGQHELCSSHVEIERGGSGKPHGWGALWKPGPKEGGRLSLGGLDRCGLTTNVTSVRRREQGCEGKKFIAYVFYYLLAPV